ncbi:Translocation and assembly module subunit TamA [Vibrio stylophorae]|uniref:Translocation and assembly module subunit TamA n=1 Tax=Vibrio stylophorae TaxID=659351 RepID=A0ABN8DXE5_9VIBR|nr:autotransporter assembly complex family protein [Vibrio stylophorae]CAH0534490.1 Translocation and assembly module subunit TamA [Vibrio stylophorae]
MLRIRDSLITFLFCLLFSATSIAAPKIKVSGVEGALADNVQVYIDSLSTRDIEISQRFQRQLESTLNHALNALGYYQPSYEIKMDGEADKGTIYVHITPGRPVRYQTIDLSIEGAAKDDPDFKTIIESAPKVGDIVAQYKYDDLKSKLRALALRKGYFDADFSLSKLEIAPSHFQGFLRLHFNSGPRYYFGDVTFEGAQIRENRLRSMLPFQPGDPYDADVLGEYTQRLSNANWFSSLVVQPELDNLKGLAIPIRVQVAPAAENKVETGLGYSTDQGMRFKINWSKPWINSLGHSIDTKLSLSRPEKTAEIAYKFPLNDVLNDYYQVQFGWRDLNNNDTDSTEYTLSFERHWMLESGWHRTAFVRWSREEFVQGLDEGITNLVLPGISYSRTRSRGGSMPTWADKQQITFEVSDEVWLSDVQLARLRGRTAWIRSLGENHRFLTRLDGGIVMTGEFSEVPPSIRYFAGGDNSIRGYSYESLSPRDASGQLTGGQYLATGSLEYQYRVMGNWWLATFVDSGSAWTDEPVWYTGTGVGIRWASPLGPIRLDFAWGLDEEVDDNFQIHLALGPEF